MRLYVRKNLMKPVLIIFEGKTFEEIQNGVIAKHSISN